MTEAGRSSRQTTGPGQTLSANSVDTGSALSRVSRSWPQGLTVHRFRSDRSSGTSPLASGHNMRGEADSPLSELRARVHAAGCSHGGARGLLLRPHAASCRRPDDGHMVRGDVSVLLAACDATGRSAQSELTSAKPYDPEMLHKHARRDFALRATCARPRPVSLLDEMGWRLGRRRSV